MTTWKKKATTTTMTWKDPMTTGIVGSDEENHNDDDHDNDMGQHDDYDDDSDDYDDYDDDTDIPFSILAEAVGGASRRRGWDRCRGTYRISGIARYFGGGGTRQGSGRSK